MRYVDPDGMAPYDIIIDGDADFKKQALEALQQLTSETLALDDDGKVIITGCSGTDNCPTGSDLVSDLVNSDKNVFIRKGSGYNRTQPWNKKGQIREDGTPNEGTNSTIFWVPNERESGADEDGNSETEPFIILGHELGHARELAEGIGDNSPTNPRIIDPDGSETILEKDEYRNRKFENNIRSEQNEPLRITGPNRKAEFLLFNFWLTPPKN